MPFSASSWVRRLATSAPSLVSGRYSYACSCSSAMNVALELGLGLIARLRARRPATNSATTVLSELTAIGSYAMQRGASRHAASSNVSSRSR